MGWLIGAAVVLGGVLLLTQVGQRGFAYRGRRYRRHADGSFTYVDGSAIGDPEERAEVEAHWRDSQGDNGSSDSGDGDGGGGGD